MRTLVKILVAPVVVTATVTALATTIGMAGGALYAYSQKDKIVDTVGKCKTAATKVKEVFKDGKAS